MRLVDCFIDTFLYLRNFSRLSASQGPEYDVFRAQMLDLFDQSKKAALENGYSDAIYTSAKFSVVAFADEMVLCSPWAHKGRWQKETLQRLYFDTANAGTGFYEKLNALNKFGPDRDVREVYSLCMGLGFRGMYFNASDVQKYEEIKTFNLGILLPDEAQRNIDTAILFPSAYGESVKRIKGDYRPRFNIIPYVIATPIMLIAIVAVYSSRSISATLNAIASMVY